MEGIIIDMQGRLRKEIIKYPIYLRYKSGAEWSKISSEKAVVHITRSITYWCITCDTDSGVVESLLKDPDAVRCTREEFEKVYGEAQWTLTQLNIVQ